MSKPTGIAFFDFDNTIIHGDVGPLFGEFILGDRYHRIKREQGRRAADRDRRRLLARYTPYLAWLGVQAGLYKLRAVRRSKLTRSAYRALKGIPSDDYYGMMDEFVEQELVDRIYPEVVQFIREHQAAGREVVIVTTGIQALVERCVRKLPPGIHVIGCRLRERNGKFTGGVDGPLYGADKANIIMAYCQASGVDPSQCWSYSDHYSDYHMLETVGTGVCINPGKRLRRLAEERGWECLDPVSPLQASKMGEGKEKEPSAA